MQLIYFPEGHKQEGLLTILVSGLMEFTEEPGVYNVEETTLQALYHKDIPYQCLLAEDYRIYDLVEYKYPQEYGRVFRSLQVHECLVCGSRTNRAYIGGWPGGGTVRTLCPQATECWHHVLEDVLAQLQSSKVDSDKKQLRSEIVELRYQHRFYIQYNLFGNFNMDQKRKITNVRAFRVGQPCSHRIRPFPH